MKKKMHTPDDVDVRQSGVQPSLDDWPLAHPQQGMEVLVGPCRLNVPGVARNPEPNEGRR